MPTMYKRQVKGLGIDVSADRLFCVEMDDSLRIQRAEVVARADMASIADWARTVDFVAIDAPAALSTAPHRDDAELGAKFRTGRCAEIGLGRQRGMWVPWVTPIGPPIASWIQTGFDLFTALFGVTRTIETYPHAIFRTLSDEPLPNKTTVEGARIRVRLLNQAGIIEPLLGMWTHDGIDATGAALVAIDAAKGVADAVTCGHDGSAIWLPRKPVD